MNGIEISRAYFEEYGLPMLREQFPDMLGYIAAGIMGSGSECIGFDDELSRDHDYEAGFCIFLPGEDVVDRRTAFLMERAYSRLPREFMGIKRPLMMPAGGQRRGVMRTGEFFLDRTGTSDGILSVDSWFGIPEQSLLECVNGEIFFDGYGEVSEIRERLQYYPDDIMKKKLAGELMIMAQSGQYNYKRCIDHGEEAAAQLAVFSFVKSAMSAVFMLNRRYMPFYKWSFRALRSLPRLALLAELFEYLITTDNSQDLRKEKYDVIEAVASDISDELMEQKISKAVCSDLEKHASSINDSIEDPGIRNMHILAAVR